jgi:hypothetical protein
MTGEDRLRTVDVKHHYADDPVARPALLALLVGATAAGPDHNEALDRLGDWRAVAADDGTPDYLFARQHLASRNYALAAQRLDAALSKRLPVPRVVSEALRLRIEVACALGDGPEARAALDRYRGHPLVTQARAHSAAALVLRCTR